MTARIAADPDVRNGVTPFSRVDRAYYEEIAGLLHGLLIRLDDRLPGKDVTLIAEDTDANELGKLLNRWRMSSPKTSVP